MLPRRLTGAPPTAVVPAVVVALLMTVAAGCAQVDGTDRGAIRENVIEPGITAIDESRAFACDSDASTLRTALEFYELAAGVPAPDEAALVDGGYIRSGSELWDVVDGRLVARHPDCGDVTTTLPATEP